MGFGLYKNEIQGEKKVGFGTNSEQSKWFEKKWAGKLTKTFENHTDHTGSKYEFCPLCALLKTRNTIRSLVDRPITSCTIFITYL